eukprot:703088-Pelagomonas_calceolata.AAC.1
MLCPSAAGVRAKDALAGAGRPVNLVRTVTSSALSNFATRMKCLKECHSKGPRGAPHGHPYRSSPLAPIE